MGSLQLCAEIQIPVIDISGYIRGDERQAVRIAAELHSACQSPGFFQITGHGVSAAVRSACLTKLAEFFALSAEVKQTVHRDNSRCLRGYEAVGEQRLEDGFADQKEGFTIGPELFGDARFLQGVNQWPSEESVPGFRHAFTAYLEEVHNFSKVMFRLMALSLGLDEGYFDAFAGSKDSIYTCRGLRYPPTTPEIAQQSRGIGAHTDWGALTVLLQDDVGGLEVLHRPTQTWHPVKPVKDAFVINIGDMMERWTNQKYSSTMHRVISPVSTKYRYSVAFFYHGLLDQIIECIPSCLSAGENPIHSPVKVEDHLRMKYESTY